MRLLHVLVAACLLAACASEATTADPNIGASDTSGEPAEIQLMLFGDPVETAGYNDLIAAFEEQNTNVKVTLSPVADQDELLAKLTTSFAGGTPPDTFLINYRRYGQFAAEGALADVQPYLDDSDVLAEDEFAPTSMDAFRFDGESLTCMPQNVSSLVVYYNADLFAEAGLDTPAEGWTWDDFLAAAKAMTKGDTYGLGVEPSLIRVAPFVWSNGGEVVDDELEPTTLTLTEPAALEALDFFLDLQLKHNVVPPDREEQSLESESRFLQGKLGMYMNSRRVVPTLRTIEDFEWDVAPVPVAPGGEQTTILHGDAYCMTEASEHKDATWQFIEFANSKEGQEILSASGRTVPSRTGVAESDAFLESDQPPASSDVFVDAIPSIRAVPHTATWSQVEGEADTILEGMFYGRIDREEGMQQLIDKTTPLFGDE